MFTVIYLVERWRQANEVCEEPEHGTCCRIIMFPLSICICVPAALFLVVEAVTTPIQLVGMVLCKLTVCKCCCPDAVHHTARNVLCSPCRWMRISCTGRGVTFLCVEFFCPYQLIVFVSGHVSCWKHPAWPFRPN